jgi:hypothetical protein
MFAESPRGDYVELQKKVSYNSTYPCEAMALHSWQSSGALLQGQCSRRIAARCTDVCSTPTSI